MPNKTALPWWINKPFPTNTVVDHIQLSITQVLTATNTTIMNLKSLKLYLILNVFFEWFVAPKKDTKRSCRNNVDNGQRALLRSNVREIVFCHAATLGSVICSKPPLLFFSARRFTIVTSSFLDLFRWNGGCREWRESPVWLRTFLWHQEHIGHFWYEDSDEIISRGEFVGCFWRNFEARSLRFLMLLFRNCSFGVIWKESVRD